MIELTNKKFEIKKIKDNKSTPQQSQTSKESAPVMTRPSVVDAKVYKLKSAFVKNSVFITLSYMEEEGKKRPVEIFINSKDLSRSHEYIMLTRLISAVFRRDADVMFILEELQGILDPEGGRFKEGNFYQSLYAEIAEVIETFFYDVGILDRPSELTIANDNTDSMPPQQTNLEEKSVLNNNFKICPSCSNQTLKVENGCDLCQQCGYSKCDK
tara:strand:+ start:1055 stop:1693 length:639 start_codon:yes stop_codon:yes gene_type:complete